MCSLYMAKKIEEKYKELTEVEHVLLRPGMWVGSTKPEEKDMFIYNTKTAKMEQVTLNYVPAMLKVVDEVISNSCDEFRRKDNLGLNKLVVEISGDTISVYDNGGIPVVKHKEAGVYVPEFIFGRLRTSSNYDDNEDRMLVGTNGVGAGLTNTFSKLYKVETADGKNKFYRSWHDNMNLSDDLLVEKCDKKTHFTKTTFLLDLPRFNVKHIDQDFINIIHKRCIDAAVANPGLSVTFITNGDKYDWEFKSFDEYLDLYTDYINLTDKIKFENKLAQAYIFPDSSVDIGFVNGAECSKGTHMRVLRSEINARVCDFLTKKDKLKDLSPRSIENKYSVFMNINVLNPAYSSQTKEELTTVVDNFTRNENDKWTIDEKFFKEIENSEIVELVRDWYKKKVAAEDEKTLRKLNKEASKGLKRSDKFIPANSRKKKDKILFIFEGDSAASGFPTSRDPQIHAGYLMRGVPMNPTGMTPIQIMKNDVYNDLITILGLKFGQEFNIDDLNFGKICIATDADTDGDKICGLLLAFFANWPELFEKHIVCRLIAPIIIAKKNKDRKYFYEIDEFEKEAKKLKNWQIKYTKGLGGQDPTEYKKMLREPIYLYFDYDNQAESMLRRWFGDDSNQRKQLMEN